MLGLLDLTRLNAYRVNVPTKARTYNSDGFVVKVTNPRRQSPSYFDPCTRGWITNIDHCRRLPGTAAYDLGDEIAPTLHLDDEIEIIPCLTHT